MKATKLAAIAALAFLAIPAIAEKIPLWPQGAMPDAQEHQTAGPYLEWLDPPAESNRNGVCAILIPGGSYKVIADAENVRSWHERLAELGVTCAKLVYRTPRPKGMPMYKTAFEDGQRAVRIARAAAAERGFDPEKIGVFSMSAGSHLATLLATSSQTSAYDRIDALDDIPCHINFACTFAVAYALSDGFGIKNTREGDAPDVKLDKIFKFDDKTCAMCLMHGQDDPYSPLASTRIYRRLREKGVPAELHLYPRKGHVPVGIERAVEFLRQMDFLPRGEEIAIMERFADDSARSGEAEKIPIWPKGKTPDFRKNQCTPYIQWHIPAKPSTRAIQIIYSGGAYRGNGPDSFETAPARRYLNAKGMTVVTLRYRTPRPKGLAKHTTAWQDVERAIRMVRNEAPRRGLDPDRIGVMGSSAGGHLTLMAATSSRRRPYWPIDEIDDVSSKVQWAVAIYPAYALTDGLDDFNTTGGNSDKAVLAPEFSFDPDTPPVLFVHGDSDKWAAMNSVKAWEQLRRMGVDGELHTLARRGHCFQRTASPGTGSYTYLDRIWEFMTTEGFNK